MKLMLDRRTRGTKKFVDFFERHAEIARHFAKVCILMAKISTRAGLETSNNAEKCNCVVFASNGAVIQAAAKAKERKSCRLQQ